MTSKGLGEMFEGDSADTCTLQTLVIKEGRRVFRLILALGKCYSALWIAEHLPHSISPLFGLLGLGYCLVGFWQLGDEDEKAEMVEKITYAVLGLRWKIFGSFFGLTLPNSAVLKHLLKPSQF